ncbi:RIBOSOMAL PROTEIN L7AE FAMILY MEMBER protein, putative [Babesia bigemina]|uniref:RIBOSOMAL PROTEIN L7AE FAMILY MEMBER protein, putative n=1 Tax=Babesia bigemina TaxID=5866 RepID=A0A061D1A3_BABBI|nr:RIBOSOMAL PROTEIN L7AE FAMILY MEMBER protein, putative [Babesia bigemina]CDR94413.1 RIBOSOMAL PROTEIN L7AE FAMILY MEMBER protein, putative [Babesia bigemina]|eukprot:XP_012766599.1 RIBOSOMAL PROTEIN L7AE FAMILY MEMBER protein, putative [Babesia bigemina]
MAKPELYRLNRTAKAVSVDKKTRKEIAKDSGKPASKPIAVIPKVGVSALDNEKISVSVPTLEKAIDALQARAAAERESRTRNLLEDPSGSYVYLQVFLRKVFTETHVRPLQIKLGHPIYRGKDVCVFVKDPQKHWKKVLTELKVREVKKVIAVDKLRKKYREYKDRRLLVNSFDLFLSDKAVAPSLPSLLGKIFMEKKKLPISLTLNRDGMRDRIEEAIQSTFYRVSHGNCSGVKVALTSMTREEIVANVLQVIEAVKKFHMRDEKFKSKISGIYLSWEGSESLCLYSEELEAVEDIIGAAKEKKSRKS